MQVVAEVVQQDQELEQVELEELEVVEQVEQVEVLILEHQGQPILEEGVVVLELLILEELQLVQVDQAVQV
jgi:hypothetical protein